MLFNFMAVLASVIEERNTLKKDEIELRIDLVEQKSSLKRKRQSCSRCTPRTAHLPRSRRN